jgi:hypothetical protein
MLMFRRAALFALGLAAIVLSVPAYAELEVMSSTAPALKAGTKLSDDAEFHLGAGEVVRLLNVRLGKTYEIQGPFVGSLDQYKKACPWWRSALGTCAQKLPEDPDAALGATRGLPR